MLQGIPAVIFRTFIVVKRKLSIVGDLYLTVFKYIYGVGRYTFIQKFSVDTGSKQLADSVPVEIDESRTVPFLWIGLGYNVSSWRIKRTVSFFPKLYYLSEE